ncbi:50S ribosomal protein L13 [Candidatus Woesearchaeota archaeon]|nr:50S ribosomal protein L13 [Candidatus Woesearchaeota archaeon]
MIIDGTHSVVGRVASFAAKKALLGENVVVVNCEKMILTGTRAMVLARFREKEERGHPYHGPFISKMPDRVVRRTIRGMLPHRAGRGKDAYEQIMCYLGVPEQFKNEKSIKVENADIKRLKTKYFVTLQELAQAYGKHIQ